MCLLEVQTWLKVLVFLSGGGILHWVVVVKIIKELVHEREMFAEHDSGVRVSRGAAESNTSFSSALQTSQVHS